MTQVWLVDKDQAMGKKSTSTSFVFPSYVLNDLSIKKIRNIDAHPKYNTADNLI